MSTLLLRATVKVDSCEKHEKVKANSLGDDRCQLVGGHLTKRWLLVKGNCAVVAAGGRNVDITVGACNASTGLVV